VSHTKISHFIGNVSHVQTAISHWLVNDLLPEMSIHIVLNALANCSPKSAMLALNQLPVLAEPNIFHLKNVIGTMTVLFVINVIHL